MDNTPAISSELSAMTRLMAVPLPTSFAVGGQRRSDDLFVVACIDVAVRVGGLRPIHGRKLAPVSRRRGWFDQRRSADLLIAGGIRLHDDELAAIVVDEQPIAIAHDEPGGPAGPLPGHRLGFPQTLAGRRPQTPELAVAADAVDVIADDHRRRDRRVQAVGLNLVVGLALPQ